MSADILLSRLDRVKPTGESRWMACCPAHDDRTPSLTVSETGDGTVLVKCWAGCGAADIVAAVGLELKDLFPERPDFHKSTRASQRWVPRDVIRALSDEVVLVVVAAETLANGQSLTADDRKRLVTAASRFRAAAKEVGYDR